MKKLLEILVLFLFWCNVSFAEILKLNCSLYSFEGDDRVSKSDIDNLIKCNKDTIYEINGKDWKVTAFNQGCPPKDNVPVGILTDKDDKSTFWWTKGPSKGVIEGNEIAVFLSYKYYEEEKTLIRTDYIAEDVQALEDIFLGKKKPKGKQKILIWKRKCI